MASSDPNAKQLRIKTGVLKRTAKEKVMYQKEAEQEEKRLERMEAEGKDEYDLRKQKEVIDESKAMIPDTQRRLNAAWADLNQLVEKCNDMGDVEEFKNAKQTLEDTKEAAEQ